MPENPGLKRKKERQFYPVLTLFPTTNNIPFLSSTVDFASLVSRPTKKRGRAIVRYRGREVYSLAIGGYLSTVLLLGKGWNGALKN